MTFGLPSLAHTSPSRNRHEQEFVYHLLLHLKCNEIDPEYVPVHGHGATPRLGPSPTQGLEIPQPPSVAENQPTQHPHPRSPDFFSTALSLHS